jgi:hypothetical protein
LILLKEYYYEDSTLAAYCNVPSDPAACISSVDVSLSGGTSTASISSTATATSKPAGDWTEEEIAPGVSLWTRYEFKLLDVSACALTSDCELTLQYQTVRSTVRNFQGFELHVDAGWVFSLENTQWNYLPEDSTDTTNTGSLPSSPSPVSTKPKGPGRKLYSTCADCPGDGKKASYFAYISAGYGTVDPSVLAAPITFELSLPNGVTGYRPGSSSNFGAQTASDPDYKFLTGGNEGFNAPTSNGQSITTSGAVNGATVTVTSFDYGGVALLRAKAQIGGTWIYATAGALYDELGAELPSPSCAVAGNDTRGFVQIPIDTDCNWIADSWEFEPAMQALQFPHFPRYWDQEKTSTANAAVVKGDGYGAYDEYRGFHVLEEQQGQANITTTNPIHKRTDPVKLTSFYHDKTSGKLIRPGIKAFLIEKLKSEIEFFEINAAQYEESDEKSSLPFNGNSEAPDNLRNFALVLGSSNDPNICSDQSFGSAFGRGKRSENIVICVEKINAQTNNSTLRSTALAVLSAHEVGHRFNLLHYYKSATYNTNKVALADAISVLDVEPPKYAEAIGLDPDITIFSKLRFRKVVKQDIVSILPIDNIDYFLYDEEEMNHALSGLNGGEPKILLDEALAYTSFQNLTPEQSLSLVARIDLGAYPSSSTRYKQPAKIEVYDRSRVMSHWFLFDIAFSNLAAYHFSTPSSANPEFVDDIGLLQLNK